MAPPPPDEDGPRCAWPRQYNELSLPLSPLHMGTIYIPTHMTEAEWAVVYDVLALIRQATLSDEQKSVEQGSTRLTPQIEALIEQGRARFVPKDDPGGSLPEIASR